MVLSSGRAAWHRNLMPGWVSGCFMGDVVAPFSGRAAWSGEAVSLSGNR